MWPNPCQSMVGLASLKGFYDFGLGGSLRRIYLSTIQHHCTMGSQSIIGWARIKWRGELLIQKSSWWLLDIFLLSCYPENRFRTYLILILSRMMTKVISVISFIQNQPTLATEKPEKNLSKHMCFGPTEPQLHMGTDSKVDAFALAGEVGGCLDFFSRVFRAFVRKQLYIF